MMGRDRRPIDDGAQVPARPARSTQHAALRAHSIRLAVALVMICGMGGCAGTRHYKSAQQAGAAQDWDRAAAEYMLALKAQPGNEVYRLQLVKALHEAAYMHIARGKDLAEAQDYKGALAEYQKAREYEPSNTYLPTLAAAAEAALNPPKVEEGAPAEPTRPPVAALNPLPDTPVKLDFKSANVKDILKALGKYANINFVFEDGFPEKNYSITLENVSFEQALTSIMIATHNFYRIIDSSTILVAQDNQMKRRSLEPLQVRTFYLSNVEAEEMRQLLQQSAALTFSAINKSTNAIVIRDTPEKLKVAEQIIRANDKSKAEILIELEIVEVNRQRVRQFGLDIGTNGGSQPMSASGAFSPDGATGGLIKGRDFLTANSLDYVFTLPTAAYKMLLSDSDSKIIANPKLRGVEGKPMSLKMGDRVPIPVTTFTPIAGGGVNQQPITSFQYENIGINVDITSRVHRNTEITMELKLDISSISGTGFGGLPTFGNRQVTATMRLREGESNLLGGLLREEERKFTSGLPGIKNIPLIGKIFSYSDNRKTQTDIVLTLTPHIIRLPDITDRDRQPIWMGTQENPSPMSSLPQMKRPSERPEMPMEMGEEPGRPGRPGRPGMPLIEPPEEEEEEEPPELPPSGKASVMLNPESSEVAVGSQFTIAVDVGGVQNLSSVNMVLHYDPARLSLLDANVQEGSFMRQEGGTTSFFRTVDRGSGRVTVGITRSGAGKGASGAGNLVTLVFDATSEGPCSVGIAQATFTNALYQPVAVDASAIADIEVYSEDVDEPPEPEEEE